MFIVFVVVRHYISFPWKPWVEFYKGIRKLKAYTLDATLNQGTSGKCLLQAFSGRC